MNYYISNIKLKSDTWYMNMYLSRFQEAAIFRQLKQDNHCQLWKIPVF